VKRVSAIGLPERLLHKELGFGKTELLEKAERLVEEVARIVRVSSKKRDR
jgi:hypothetical protein